MKINDLMARQLANPSGVFGRLIVSRLLNKVNLRSNEAVFELLEVNKDSVVLEIGFGGGDLLLKISQRSACHEIHGMEISTAMLEALRAKVVRRNKSSSIHLRQGSIEAMPFEQDRFDRICSVNTIYFWPDLNKGLGEIARVSLPGGLLVLGFGSDVALRAAGYEERGFILYTAEQVIGALSESGFEVDTHRTLERIDRGVFHIIRSKLMEPPEESNNDQ